MQLEDLLKCYIEAYFGMQQMDEYDLKEFILKDIEDYIKNFVSVNNIDKKLCTDISEHVINKVEIKTKLQSSLILLNKMNAPIELILLIKKKIKKQN